ncbi:hypothetical protein [Sodalis-like endosymbiont of Proechinophthirus fluctus]|uniref:hypothetical protein n=1 Tax=Sodalis-like endosymbiont of Proechinophthirus fluctus TaxID=1462730 RepID=UPI000829CEAB|nr:hypothetical protein [Sodalis-like endosymbiont of Proechinophthirus fluctus]
MQGFEYGSTLLQFDTTSELDFLDQSLGRIRVDMPQYIPISACMDQDFNKVSTYVNFLRLMSKGKLPDDPGRQNYWRFAVQRR